MGVGLASHVLNASFQGMIHTSAFCTAVAAGAVASRVQQMDSLCVASETLTFHRPPSTVRWYEEMPNDDKSQTYTIFLGSSPISTLLDAKCRIRCADKLGFAC